MARFIDLDEIAPEPVVVILDGERYRLPGDIPIPEYIALDALARRALTTEDAEDASEVFQDITEHLLDLFRVHQPEMEGLPIGPRTLLPLVLQYLNGADDGDPDEEAAPVPPTRRAGTKTKPSSARRSTTTKTPATRRKASVS